MFRSLPVISGLLLAILTSIAAANTCVPRGEACTDTAATSLASGFRIGKTCLEQEVSETCTDPEPENTCQELQASAACEELSSSCIAVNSGECDRTRQEFECLNEDQDMGSAELIKTSFENFSETVEDSCSTLGANPRCILNGTRDFEPGGTKDINRLPVTRSWWHRARDYVCVSGEVQNECAAFESDPICRILESSCLSATPEGVCVQEEIRYKCGVAGDLDTSCRSIDVCIAGNCDGFEEPANADFPVAAAWLNVLNEMSEDVDAELGDSPEDVAFFDGANRACRQTALGFRNCCNLDGWIANGECLEPERDLHAARQAGAAHYVGSYCSVRVLWICTAHKRSYCRFGSKFARVFQEQAREQLGWSWGSPKTPDCRGLTIADLDQIDMESFDLSEVFGDMFDDAERPDAGQIMDLLRSRMTLAPRQAQQIYE